MFLNYLSRIHRDDDFNFMTNGFVRLLNNPLKQSYLPGSSKKIQFAQELLILFWKCCDYNKVAFWGQIIASLTSVTLCLFVAIHVPCPEELSRAGHSSASSLQSKRISPELQ